MKLTNQIVYIYMYNMKITTIHILESYLRSTEWRIRELWHRLSCISGPISDSRTHTHAYKHIQHTASEFQRTCSAVSNSTYRCSRPAFCWTGVRERGRYVKACSQQTNKCLKNYWFFWNKWLNKYTLYISEESYTWLI